jgi:hypothetical protein
MIQLELTEAEYRKLVESMYLADWVTNAHTVSDGVSNPYSLDQKIYKKAQSAGCGDLVDYAEKEKVFLPSRKLEEKGHDVLDEYDEETFWEELVNRLAVRDIEEEKGPDALEKMSPEEQFRLVSQMEERYQTESETYGIDRLEIVEE